MNMKRCDQSFSVNVTSVTGVSSLLLSTIAQGVGDNQRVGQRVRFFNWHVRGSVEYVPAATGVVQADYIRVIFFYDRQQNNAASTYAQLISNIGGGGNLAYDPPNWYTRGRFKILRDFRIVTPPIASTVAGGLITVIGGSVNAPAPISAEFQIDFFKALKGKLDCEWSGTGSTAANISGGGLNMQVQNTQGTGFWVLSGTSSVEYMDV
jgi:hypothetical protein